MLPINESTSEHQNATEVVCSNVVEFEWFVTERIVISFRVTDGSVKRFLT